MTDDGVDGPHTDGRGATHTWDDVLGWVERLVADRYGGERPLGDRPGLLLVDLYRKVFGDRREPLEQALERFPASCGPAAWDALGPLQELLHTARHHGVPVAHTTGEPRPEAQLGGTGRRPRGRSPEALAWDYEIVEQLAPREDELVVYKNAPSAFFDTPLSTWLRRRRVDTLVVAGESTSGCVRASVVDAFSHGFDVVVAEDATFDRSPLSHKASLFDLHHKYATVLRQPAALTYMRDPTTPVSTRALGSQRGTFAG